MFNMNGNKFFTFTFNFCSKIHKKKAAEKSAA